MVCTIGPASANVDTLETLIRAGMNIARLNFSHGTHEYHADTLAKVREAAARVPECPVQIMLDTQGPEIRTGTVKDDKIEIEKDQDVFVSTDNSIVGCYSEEQKRVNMSCTYQKIVTTVKPGDVMLCADGGLSLEVTEVQAGGVLCKALNAFKLGTRKNMNLPKCYVDLPILKEKDIDDVQNFGIKHQVDMIAASFVQNAENLKFIRKTLGEEGKHIKIISKIENQEGLKNYDEILEHTDGIMVARGDLGMEVDLWKVPFLTKEMIDKARNRPQGRVPVIVATQMLESMISNPRPTRAESTDVFQAVLDGADAVMLSGESANGTYPLQAVTFMANCVREAEYISKKTALKYNLKLSMTPSNTLERTAQKLANESMNGDLKWIINMTEDAGNKVAKELTRWRPNCTVVQFSPANKDTAWSNTQYGTLVYNASGQEGVASFIEHAVKYLGFVKGSGTIAILKVTGEDIELNFKKF